MTQLKSTAQMRLSTMIIIHLKLDFMAHHFKADTKRIGTRRCHRTHPKCWPDALTLLINLFALITVELHSFVKSMFI
ncbi:uncharacterized protein LOC116805970 isoform X3 [Drosophila grimshawi]|uniref:uncharacterized protein LOC116805970 isoform X3 n=1 Tax=Drosophila grimshawi TaxID=7222 RepID=UPI000C86E55B|nr:uncharacterized protein LOC116805970 isoform X3 [Drosophila grimshawi]